MIIVFYLLKYSVNSANLVTPGFITAVCHVTVLLKFNKKHSRFKSDRKNLLVECMLSIEVAYIPSFQRDFSNSKLKVPVLTKFSFSGVRVAVGATQN